jgi:hypothetical protein
MPAWATGAWATGAWAGTAWQEAAPVEVPDVVGLTQEAATLALEAAGFAVAVVTAASSAVAAGSVISQSPAGGEFATDGSTVTITVSSGDTDILDAKFQGYPNVRVKGLGRDKKDDEPKAPLPAQITNMPDGPPVPPPEEGALARGLDLGLLPAVEVQPLPLVEIEPPVVVVKPRAPEPLVQETPNTETAPPAVSVEPPVQAPAPVDFAPISTAIQAAVEAQTSALTEQLVAVSAQLAAAVGELAALRAQMKRDRDLDALNRKRAAEIARKLSTDR